MATEQLILLLIQFLLWIGQGSCMPSFVKSMEIQNRFCSAAATVNFGISRSLLECSGRCFNDVLCKSLFYKQSGICVGCMSILYDSGGCLAENGTRYYIATAMITSSTVATTTTATTTVVTTPLSTTALTATTPPTTTDTDFTSTTCMSSVDCPFPHTTCWNFLCTCIPGYSLFIGTLTFSCVNGCTTYGNTFIRYHNRALADPDGIYYENTSEDTCRSICTGQNLCRGYNFNTNAIRCMIVFGTALSLSDYFMPHSNIEYFNRNCENTFIP